MSTLEMSDVIAALGADQLACNKPFCPLNKVKAGMAVRIKQLCAEPGVTHRLREIGFCEEQVIRLLASQVNVICLVCNARMAISEQLAQSILVEPLSPTQPA